MSFRTISTWRPRISMCCRSVFTLRLRDFENLVENAVIAIESRFYGASNLAFFEPIAPPSVLLNAPDCRVHADRKLFVFVEIVVERPEYSCIDCGRIRSCALWLLDLL